MSIFEEYGTFKIYTCTQCLSAINVYKITKPTLLLLIISPLNNVGISFDTTLWACWPVYMMGTPVIKCLLPVRNLKHGN